MGCHNFCFWKNSEPTKPKFEKNSYSSPKIIITINIEILKISIDDLKSESYESIEHIGYVENEDWDTLKTLVTEKEVKAIQEEFKEDNERYRNEHECGSSPCDCNLNLYKAILYCNEEYVWSATTYSFDDWHQAK